MRCILCSSLINGHTVSSDTGRSDFGSGLLYSSDGRTVWHQCSHHRSVSEKRFSIVIQPSVCNIFVSSLMLQGCCGYSICGTLYILVCIVSVKTVRYCLLHGSSANFGSISLRPALWRVRIDYDLLKLFPSMCKATVIFTSFCMFVCLNKDRRKIEI